MQRLQLLRLFAWPTAACLLTVSLAGAGSAAGAQTTETSLAIDVGVDGNGPTELGDIENCIEAKPGQEFQVDFVIQNVVELLAWEIYLEYDPEILQIVHKDVEMFQAANAGSSVFDASHPLPDDDGFLLLSAADTSDPPTPDSGSGTLARITVRALAAGQSPLEYSRLDIDNDGEPDFGPLLRNVSNDIIRDEDGDTFFDGPTEGAIAAIDIECPIGSSVVVQGEVPDGGGSSSTWIFVGAGVASALVVAAVGAAVVLFRKTRSPL